VELLVARPTRTQGELVDAISGEAGVRVAVDETRNGGKSTTVHLDYVVTEGGEPPHRADLRDPTGLAEDVRVGGELERAQRSTSERCRPAGRCRHLREVANQES
jgi:hypothetical protein